MAARRGGRGKSSAAPKTVVEASSLIEIPERKLTPVYEALDNNDNKKALRLSSNLLEKIAAARQPPRAIALRSLALARLGKTQEASQELDRLIQLAPPDESVLNIIKAVARVLGDHGKFAECLAGVCAKKPNDLNFASARFLAIASTFDWKQAQLVATQLHKLVPQNPQFLFWYSISIYLQAVTISPSSASTTATSSSPSAAASSSSLTSSSSSLPVVTVSPQGRLMLSLVERMLTPLISESGTGPKVTNQQELLFYLSILKLQCKWSECLQLVESKLGATLLQPADRLLATRAELHASASHVELAIADYTTLIEVYSPDDWRLYVLLFEQIAQLPADGEDRATQVQASLALIHRLIEKHGRTLRGPYLALIEHGRRFGFPSSSEGDAFVDLLLKYTELFGGKCACLRDTLLFSSSLVPEQKSAWRAAIARRHEELLARPLISFDVSTDATTERHLVDQLGHELTALKTKIVLQPVDDGDNDTNSNNIKELASLLDRYLNLHELPFHIAKGDRHPADDFVLLLGITLHEQYSRSRQLAPLLLAVQLLEHSLQTSPYNFQFRLLLIHLYSYIGAFQPAHRHYLELQIKSVQLDTMSYLIVGHAIRLGFPQIAQQLITDILTYHSRSAREAGDLLSEPLRKASYCKIQEVLDFRLRLSRSVTLAAARTESVFLSLALSATPAHHASQAASSSSSVSLPASFPSSPSFTIAVDPSLILTEEQAAQLISNQDTSVYESWTPGAAPFRPCTPLPASNTDYANAMTDAHSLEDKKRLLLARQSLWSRLSAAQAGNIGSVGSATSSSVAELHLTALLESLLQFTFLLAQPAASSTTEEAEALCLQAGARLVELGAQVERLFGGLSAECATALSSYQGLVLVELLDKLSYFGVTFFPATAALSIKWNDILGGLRKKAPAGLKSLKTQLRQWATVSLAATTQKLVDALNTLGSQLKQQDPAAALVSVLEAAELELFGCVKLQKLSLRTTIARDIVNSHAQSCSNLAQLFQSQLVALGKAKF